MEKINFKAIWSVLDLKTLIILGLIAYIGFSLIFGDSNKESKLLKKENIELHAKNDSIDNVLKAKDIVIKELQDRADTTTKIITALSKQHNDNLNEIQKLKKKKNETPTIVDNSTDAEILQFLSDRVNTK